jgi:asparagine synthase (glutamine-hydrolysing)
MHSDRRIAAVLDADDDFIQQRILSTLAPVEPASDRVFIAYCIADLYGHLSTLLHRHDRMGMAASIEMRVPFLENRIIDFAIHLPLQAKLHGGRGKWIVKKAAARWLPAQIAYGKKKGFPTPDGFVRGTERLLLKGRLAETMHWSQLATEHIVAMLESDRQLCFYLVGVELWLRIFFFGENVDELGDRLVALAS